MTLLDLTFQQAALLVRGKRLARVVLEGTLPQLSSLSLEDLQDNLASGGVGSVLKVFMVL